MLGRGLRSLRRLVSGWLSRVEDPMVILSNSGRFEDMLERNRDILEEVKAGRFTHGWCEMDLKDDQGNTLTVLVSCDALTMHVQTTEGEQIVENARTRITVDAYTQQEIADELGALLLTPKLLDEIYRQAPKKIPPQTGRHGPKMATTAEMIRHSEDVDAAAIKLGVSIPPAISNVGKHWVISKIAFQPGKVRLNRSVNYGWFSKSAKDRSVTGLPIIQSQGTRHTAGMSGVAGHTDYSQVSAFAHRSAKWNGAPVDLADVYTGRAPGTDLVSHEGPLPAARLPQFEGQLPPSSDPYVEQGAPSRGPGAGEVLAGGFFGGVIGFAAGGPAGAGVGAVVGAVIGAAGA